MPASLLLVCILAALSVDGFAVFPVSSPLRCRKIPTQQYNVAQFLTLDDNENGAEKSIGVTKEMLPKSEIVESESSDDEKTRSSSKEQKVRQTATPPPAPPQMSRRDIMNALGTSPERIALSFASSGLIALAANLFGITSGVLTVLPDDLVESTGLDGYYPRGSSFSFICVF
jgi:hypothetical protein